MKKRKAGRWVALALAVAAATVIVLFFKQYYDARYVLDDYYYTVVPLDYDITPYWDSQGDRVTDYKLECYNADGEARMLSFSVLIDAHKSDLYPPGTYMRVGASKQLVIGRRAVDEGSVPEKALEMIRASFAPAAASSLAEYAQERTLQLATRNTPSLTASSDADGDELVYTYVYSADARELAEGAADLLDPVYSVQFRTDKQAFPGLSAIFLEVRLSDGTVVFSKKYDTRVTFDYENE